MVGRSVMPMFPVFIDLSNRKVLVIGGGRIATRKVKNLLNFTRNITVVAPKINPTLDELAKEGRIKIKRRRFLSWDLKGADMVIVAVNDIRLQKRVFNLCEKRRILCNSVDSPEFCNFIFPSVVVRRDLSIGISTSGKAPAISKRIREIVERYLPENVEGILEKVSSERMKMKKGEERQKKMMELVDDLLPLD